MFLNMYGHVVRVSNTIKYSCSPPRIDVIYHLTDSGEFIYVKLGETMTPRPDQVYKHTVIDSLH